MENKTTITNFRDVGGCPTKDGKLESGYFYRSGQLDQISEEEKTFLKENCKIKKIFDFRSAKEVKEMPDESINGIAYQNIDILASATENGASLEAMLNDLSQIKQSMLDTYTEIVTSQSAHQGYQSFMLQLLDKKEPILFHCFAGKDRTGFGAALILKVAGASEKTIMSDYLLTNQLRKKANQKLLNQYKDQYSSEELKSLETALCVDQSYLEHAFALIQKEYGGFDRYLVEVLQLPKDFQECFQEAYVIK